MRRTWTRASRVYLLASVLLATATAFLVHVQTGRYAAAVGAARPDVPVVLAAGAIRRGQTIQPADLDVTLFPRTYVPPGSFSRISAVAGRVALTDLSRGEVVTRTRLARVRAGPVASLVPQGLRAFAVPSSLPAGAVWPGDRVDVLATFGPPRPRTETVAHEVEVLLVLRSGPGGPGAPVDLDLQGADSGGPTLIVVVSPSDQQRLAFARAFASLEVTVAPAP